MKLKNKYVIEDVWKEAVLYGDYGKERSIGKLLEVFKNTPEFEREVIEEDYEKKMAGMGGRCWDCHQYNRNRTFMASIDDTPVGALAAYDPHARSQCKDTLYLWLGSVIPEHRGNRIMSALLETAEFWADRNMFGSLSIKTYPRYECMIHTIEKNGFEIVNDENIDSVNSLTGINHLIDEEDGDTILYVKFLGRAWHLPIRQERFYQEYEERFEFNVTWKVKETIQGKLVKPDYISQKCISSHQAYLFEYGTEISTLCHPNHDFRIGDSIELGLNADNHPAWINRPGVPLHMKKIDDEFS